MKKNIKIPLLWQNVILLALVLALSQLASGQAETLIESKLPKLNSTIVASNDSFVLIESHYEAENILALYSVATLEILKSIELELPVSKMESFWRQTDSGAVGIFYSYGEGSKQVNVYSRAFSFDLENTFNWELIYKGSLVNYSARLTQPPIDFMLTGRTVPYEKQNSSFYERGFDTIPSKQNGLFYFGVQTESPGQKGITLLIYGINDIGQIAEQKEILLPEQSGEILVNSACIHDNYLLTSLIIHDCRKAECDKMKQLSSCFVLSDMVTGIHQQKVIETSIGDIGLVDNKRINLIFDPQKEVAWAIGLVSSSEPLVRPQNNAPVYPDKIGLFHVGISIKPNADSLNYVHLFTPETLEIFGENPKTHISLFDSWIDAGQNIRSLFYCPYAQVKVTESTTPNTIDPFTGLSKPPINSHTSREKYAFHHAHEFLILNMDPQANFKVFDVIYRQSCSQHPEQTSEKRMTINGQDGFIFLDPSDFYDKKKIRKVNIKETFKGKSLTKMTFAYLDKESSWKFQQLCSIRSIEFSPNDLIQVSPGHFIGIGIKGLGRQYLFKIVLSE